jgi:antirestriction protein
VEYAGERSEEALSRFEDHYLGKFESTEAYVENLLEESDAYSFEEFVPEWLKPYVKIDVELLARDTEIELYVAESGDSGVFVFDPQL